MLGERRVHMSAENAFDAPFHPNSATDESSTGSDGTGGEGVRGAGVEAPALTPPPITEVTPVPTDDDSNTSQAPAGSQLAVIVSADAGPDGFSGASPADVLMSGPEGGLERIGSVVPASTDEEIDDLLESLQFEGGRLVMATDAEGHDGLLDPDDGEEGEAPGDDVPPDAPEVDLTDAPLAVAAGDALEVSAEGESEEDEEAALEAELRESVHRRRPLVSPALIALDRLDADATFQVRAEGDISRLATDLARVGQLFPIDVRVLGADRFQVVSGFRRLAALRFLHREFVLARVHADLSDEDAQLMALAAAIHAEPVTREQLEQVREELETAGRMFPAVRDMLEKALQDDDTLAPESPETGEDEVDADELAFDVSQRLGAINQELSMLADVFGSLDASRRAELLMQLRYSSELVAYLEGQS